MLTKITTVLNATISFPNCKGKDAFELLFVSISWYFEKSEIRKNIIAGVERMRSLCLILKQSEVE